MPTRIYQISRIDLFSRKWQKNATYGWTYARRITGGNRIPYLSYEFYAVNERFVTKIVWISEILAHLPQYLVHKYHCIRFRLYGSIYLAYCRYLLYRTNILDAKQ